MRIEPWGDDLPLLERLMGDPRMTEHIGGPESPEEVADRQALYERLADSGRGRMFKIVLAATRESVGWTGYWERTWREQAIYEIGWSVLLPFQGRGIAGMATAQAMTVACSERRHRFLHAFPSVDNAPSNAICRRLGFTLVEPCRFEYPPGRFMQANDWRLDLLQQRWSAHHPSDQGGGAVGPSPAMTVSQPPP